MKKGILFTGGLALLGFASCDDGSARIGELETELNTVKQERDAASLAHQEELTAQGATYQYKVDSLQYIIDSLTAPKGTVPSKPKPKPTTPTTKTEEPAKEPTAPNTGKKGTDEGPTNTGKKGTDGPVNTGKKGATNP